jgi:hypothetical protein
VDATDDGFLIVNVPDEPDAATAVQQPAPQFDADVCCCCCASVSPAPVVVGAVHVSDPAPSVPTMTATTSPVCQVIDVGVVSLALPARDASTNETATSEGAAI